MLIFMMLQEMKKVFYVSLLMEKVKKTTKMEWNERWKNSNKVQDGAITQFLTGQVKVFYTSYTIMP